MDPTILDVKPITHQELQDPILIKVVVEEARHLEETTDALEAYKAGVVDSNLLKVEVDSQVNNLVNNTNALKPTARRKFPSLSLINPALN